MNIKRSDMYFAGTVILLSLLTLLPWPFPDQSELRRIEGKVTEVRRPQSFSRHGRSGWIFRVDGDDGTTWISRHYLVKEHCRRPEVGDELVAEVRSVWLGPENQAMTLTLNDENLLSFQQCRRLHREKGYFFGGLGILGGMAWLAFVPMLRNVK